MDECNRLYLYRVKNWLSDYPSTCWFLHRVATASEPVIDAAAHTDTNPMIDLPSRVLSKEVIYRAHVPETEHRQIGKYKTVENKKRSRR